ncbi:MAG TPA: DNA ligase D [Anaeromyxobacteraceae bacterium]|nr:DNA ligase D [Anaeromyxobacteraceae bacterium]
MGRHAGDPLARYRSKRSASGTPEPFGPARPAPPGAPGGVFVVQKHAARRLHYDFRLEHGGVLLSWAVPKGPSDDPAVKRLAVRTEDHPLEYADFEGVIPKGNYGAGEVEIWDRGRFRWVEAPEPGLEKGKLLFELAGRRLSGVWTLVRTKRDPKEWLLIRHRDPPAGEPPAGPRDGERLGAELEAELARRGAPEGTVRARDVRPMLAEARDSAFSDDGWIFELKYDGYRAIVEKDHDRVEVRYRSGLDATALYPDLAEGVRVLLVPRVVLDGEIVVLDEGGRPDFQLLQGRARHASARDAARAARERPATYFAFDLLGLGNRDARPLPLLSRKEVLGRLVGRAGAIRYADHVEGRGEEFFRAVRSRGLEGMVAKRAEGAYRSGRSPAWLKVRVHRADDFAVVGFTDPSGARAGFGALHLAAARDGGFAYAGSVGTGFSAADLTAIRDRLDPLRRRTPPVRGAVPRGAGHHWVEPTLVAEVRYREVTRDGLLRQPVFVRLREDKAPKECAVAEGGPAPPPATGSDDPPPARARLTNPGKVFWPEDGYTKGDLLAYYRSISRWILPYLRDRPLTLTRYPDGISGKSFFQKDAPDWTPEWVRTERIYSEDAGRDIDYFVVDDVESLAYVVNLGAIPLHVTAARVADLARPDWAVLDLDPKDAPFAHVVRIALRLRDLCRRVRLPAFPKTTGQRGLHVLVPVAGQLTHAQARQLALVLSRRVADEMPDIATLARPLGERGGRVYLDCLQNGQGKTIVAPFAVRPQPGAPVSTPLSWAEVTPGLDPARFTIETVPKRMRRLGRDPMRPVLVRKPDLLRSLASLEVEYRGGR